MHTWLMQTPPPPPPFRMILGNLKLSGIHELMRNFCLYLTSSQYKGIVSIDIKECFFSVLDRRSAQPTPNEVLSLSQSSSLNVWSCWWVSGSRLIHWNDCRVPAEARLKGLSGLRKQARGKRSLIMHASGPYYCTGLLKLQWIWRQAREDSLLGPSRAWKNEPNSYSLACRTFMESWRADQLPGLQCLEPLNLELSYFSHA